MLLREKISLGQSMCKAAIFGQRSPRIASWAITNRCNLACQYCGTNNVKCPEVDTGKAFELIEKLSRNGIRLIRFTGGEPLVRNDIADIINFSARQGIRNVLSTNGILFPGAVARIDRLDGVSVSLDGDARTHDMIRGQGSFDKALTALGVAKERMIPRTILTVLSSRNLNEIDVIVKIAKDFNAKVSFQPATKTVLYGDSADPLAPDRASYRKALERLINLKKNKNRIINSISGLRYLMRWPEEAPIRCMAARIIVRIDPAGMMYACNRAAGAGMSLAENSFKDCLSILKPPQCKRCWCSSYTELNLMSSFDLGAVINSLRINIFSE